ncbi:hypothetical protein E2C01_089010 [Portunus trituberculatus]|uniref:Uncharacterized protein n=1 Tax=Portunus trituberculatus TaxID=210409 RepID=A0A5B7JGZ4_PORTR|nr:hypothetical protein [Portunus trituberculatus]
MAKFQDGTRWDSNLRMDVCRIPVHHRLLLISFTPATTNNTTTTTTTITTTTITKNHEEIIIEAHTTPTNLGIIKQDFCGTNERKRHENSSNYSPGP